MANYIHGQLINLFYYDTATSAWKTFGYTQNNSLSLSNETTSISSKDHGLNPETEITGSSWSLSGEVYFTTENAKIIIAMQEKKNPYSFAFAQVAETDHAAGLKSVTNSDNGAEKWTIGSFVRYGNGLVTSASITANNGEVATLSIEITGSGAMSKTAPTEDKLKGYSAEA